MDRPAGHNQPLATIEAAYDPKGLLIPTMLVNQCDLATRVNNQGKTVTYVELDCENHLCKWSKYYSQ